MLIDSIEARGMQGEQLDIKKQLKALNTELGTVVKPMDGCYQRLNPSVDAKISKMLDIDNTAIVTSLRSTVMDSTKEMLSLKQNLQTCKYAGCYLFHYLLLYVHSIIPVRENIW